jgi:tetratricopeptide (TPR) repeat protein
LGYGYSLKTFKKHWDKYRDYTEIGDEKSAIIEFNEINKLRLINGIEDLKPYSMLLIKEGDIYLKSGNYEKAYKSYIRATIISPNNPHPHLSLAKLYWTKNKLDIINIMGKIFYGIVLYIKNPLNKLMLLSNISSTIIMSLVISYIILTSLIFLKYSKSILHDFIHLLPKKMPKELAIFVILLISLVPIILRKGIITLSIFWMVTLGFYLKKKESIGILILSIIILFITPIFISGSLSPLLIKNNILGTIIRVNIGELNIKDRDRLIEFVKTNSNDVKALFTLALINRRLGYTEKSMEIYKELLNINPNLYRVYNNIGNILYLTGDIDNSISNYLNALKLSPNSAVSHFNLGMALRDNMLILEAERELKKARELNPILVDQYLKYNIPIDEKIPIKDLISSENIKNIIPPNMYSQNISQKAMLSDILLFIILLFYAILIKNLRKRFEPSIICIKCGNIICRRCKRIIKDEKLCLQCFNFYREHKLEESMSDYKFNEIIRYQKIDSIKNGIISLFIPGGGHILKESPIKGFIILFLFSSLIIEIILWNINLYITSFLFIMLSIIYIYSILSFFKIIRIKWH